MAQKSEKSGGKASKFARSLERGGAAPRQGETLEEGSETSAVEPQPEGRPRGRQRPEKPVRITVDLDADRHRFLRRYAADEGVRGTEVVRGLLTLLEEDPELADRLSERMAQST